jgi:hypothetical protein
VGSLESHSPTQHRDRPFFSESLAYFEAEGENFLFQIVTSDETWVHHFELERKWESMEWHHPQSPSKKKVHKVSVSGEGHGHCLLGR